MLEFVSAIGSVFSVLSLMPKKSTKILSATGFLQNILSN